MGLMRIQPCHVCSTICMATRFSSPGWPSLRTEIEHKISLPQINSIFFGGYTPNAPIGALRVSLLLSHGISVVYQVSQKYTKEKRCNANWNGTD